MTKNTGFLDRAAILAIQDAETQDVYVDRWQTNIRVRSISAGERERLLKGSIVIDPKTKEQRFDAPQMRVKLVALAAVNPDGSRMFTNDDAAAIGSKHPKAIDQIADVAMRLAGIEDEPAKADDENPLPETVSGDSSTA